MSRCWIPGTHRQFRRSHVKPTGAPLAMPFALVIMSGMTSQFSMRPFLPVRPIRFALRAKHDQRPYFLTILKTILKYSFGGVINPPTP